MGQAHFNVMYEQALDTDRRAWMHLNKMCIRKTGSSQLPDFWDSMSIDVIMEHARNIVDLADEFTDDLKQLVVERKARMKAFMIDLKSQSPKAVFVNSPELLDDQQDCPDVEWFYETMMQVPDEILYLNV